MKKEIAILLSSVALGVIITILFKRNKKNHVPITKSESFENYEIHLRRRREHILKQPIKEHVEDISLSDGFYNDEDFSDDTSFTNEDSYEGLDYKSKKRNLYLYYDSEIVRGDDSSVTSVPEYQDTSYEGYSSYRPSANADSKYFTPEKHVNVNRLCDWNWR